MREIRPSGLEGGVARQRHPYPYYEILDYMASGMTHEQILGDFPYLTEEDLRACLAFAADRERKLALVPG